MGEINSKNREELIYETLKQEILDLRFKPNQMISKNDTCERPGVSRTPVRDVFRLLQEQGFAETIPYRSIYVILLSLNNIRQMIYMRMTVETMVLRDLLKIQTLMAIEDIRHSIAQQRIVIREPGFEPEQFYRMDTQMHPTWFTAVRCQKLWEMLQVQQLHYTKLRVLNFITETDFIHIIGEHEDLLSMIVDKSEKELEKVLKERLYYSMKRMCRSIEVDHKDYLEEEDEEGRFVIRQAALLRDGYTR